MIGWVVLVAVLVLLWFCPLGIRAVYNATGPKLYWLLGPVRVKLYPADKKKKKTSSKKTDKKTEKTRKEKQKGGSYKDFLPLIKMIVAFLGEFRRKMRVRYLEMKLVMAGDDPCDLAINYGKAWAAVGNLLPLLERAFVIKKRNVEVECDFAADKTLLFLRADLVITLGRVFSLGVVHGIAILKEYFRIIKLRKGGTNQ